MVKKIAVVTRGCIICSMILALSLTACMKNTGDWEKEIISYVNENNEALLLACEKWCEAGEVDVTDIEETDLVLDIRLVSLGDENQIIVFECYMEGLLNASLQGGFYYSKQDEPSNAAIGWYSNVEPVKTENGLEWRKDDDGYVTEKICDYFYTYAAWN